MFRERANTNSLHPEGSLVDAEVRQVVSNYSVIDGKYVPTRTYRDYDGDSIVGLYSKDSILGRTFVAMDPSGAPVHVIQTGSKKIDGRSTEGFWGWAIEKDASGKAIVRDIPFASRKGNEGSCLTVPESGFIKEVITDLNHVSSENPDIEWPERSSPFLSDAQRTEMQYVGQVLDMLGDRVDGRQ